MNYTVVRAMSDNSLDSRDCLRLFTYRAGYLSLAATVFALSFASCAMQIARAPAALQPEVAQPIYETLVRFDLENAALDARAALTFVADENTAGRVAFLLNSGFQLQGVSGVAVRSYRSEPFQPVPVWNVIEVELDDTIAPGSRVSVEFTYAGRPEFPDNNINGISREWVELNLDSQWHPIFASFDQAMQGILRLELPPQWEVVASGSAAFEDGLHVIRNTVPQPDVAFAAAPSFERLRSKNFTVYFMEPGARTAAAVLEAGENCASYLNERYGTRDPLPRGRVVLADREGPGYARKNYIVLSEVDPENAAGLHYFLCHELAHYWTPSPGPFSPDHWMSEAFAEYVAVRYLRERFGQEAFDHRAVRWEEMGRSHGPVWSPKTTEPPTFDLMYRRAPHLLYRLEQRIGVEQMDRFLEQYMTEDVRSTPDLLERLAAAAGSETAQWFRDQLARGPDSTP